LFAIKNHHLMMSEAAKAKFTALASPKTKKISSTPLAFFLSCVNHEHILLSLD
jgi:hypothetical protein